MHPPSELQALAVGHESEMRWSFSLSRQLGTPQPPGGLPTESGSTGTSVSPMWITRISQLCRLSLPTKTPPGFSTRHTWRSSLSCNSAEGTWCSMVKETTPENCASCKRHGRRITGDYLDIAVTQTRTERRSQSGVDFDGGKVLNRASQHIGSEPRAWPKFQHLWSQVDCGERPRHPLLYGLPPSGRAAHPVMETIHDPHPRSTSLDSA